MIFTGDVVDAHHACEIGLVNHVVPATVSTAGVRRGLDALLGRRIGEPSPASGCRLVRLEDQ
jgi:enoyl-CoA hydratase/carnithine racemase